jgi:hypothetical protein
MPKPKPSPKRKPADPQPEATTGLNLRGLTAADHAALERAAARRSALIGGGFVSKTNALLAVLRAGLSREDITGRVENAPLPGDTSRTEGT